MDWPGTSGFEQHSDEFPGFSFCLPHIPFRALEKHATWNHQTAYPKKTCSLYLKDWENGSLIEQKPFYNTTPPPAEHQWKNFPALPHCISEAAEGSWTSIPTWQQQCTTNQCSDSPTEVVPTRWNRKLNVHPHPGTVKW